jgi:hypothetical protein
VIVSGAAVACTATLSGVDKLTIASGAIVEITQRGINTAISWLRSDNLTPITIAHLSSTSQPTVMAYECFDASGAIDPSSKVEQACKVK